MATEGPRLRAVRLLHDVLTGQGSLADRLDAARAGLSDRDGAFLQALVFGALRYGPRLEWWRDRLLDRPVRRRDAIVGTVILLGLHQLAHTRVPPHAAISETVDLTRAVGRPRAAGLVNGVLRRFLREKDELERAAASDPVAASCHPAWLADRIGRDWPEDVDQILAAGNEAPPMTLRVNCMKTGRGEYLERLREAGIDATPGADAETAVVLEAPVGVDRLPGFEDGVVSVQDESAQLVAGLLMPLAGQRVLDACAAPGGKSAHLLELGDSETELLALDSDGGRLARVDENLARLGLSAGCRVGDARRPGDWWDGRPFDRVLLDVPCSGTGVIRRHPDIKYLRREADIAGLAGLQSEILAAGWSVLAPGGVLIYTTCSVLREENEAVIRAFLEQYPEARAEGLAIPGSVACGAGRQRLPGPDGGDGFFYARIRRPDA